MTERDPAAVAAPAVAPGAAAAAGMGAGPALASTTAAGPETADAQALTEAAAPPGHAPVLTPDLAAAVAGLGSDIALVLDDAGVILRMAVGDPSVAPPGGWVGRAWADTVTGSTRGKVEQLLRDVSDRGVSMRREVNHPAPGGGQDIPVSYAAMRLGPNGPVLAAGRDLRAIAAIQQRFVASQQELERGYWRLRQAESRYRLLFQVATDAVCVLELPTLRLVEANEAAHALFAAAPGQLLGSLMPDWLDAMSRVALDERISADPADAAGREVELRARLAESHAPIELSATRFRGEQGPMLLVRARALDAMPPASMVARQRLAELVDRLPEAVLVTDALGRVLSGNPAFVTWTEAGPADDDEAAERAVRGRPLADWLTLEAPHALGNLVAALRHQGLALELQARFRGERGHTLPVVATAVLLDDDDRECLGFTLRRRVEPVSPAVATPSAWPAAVETLAAQLGRAPYGPLVEQARVELERHFARRALAVCGNDALAAAHWLGLAQGASPEQLARSAQRLQALADGRPDPSSTGPDPGRRLN